MSLRLKVTCLTLVGLATVVSARDMIAARRIEAAQAVIDRHAGGRDALLAARIAPATTTPPEAIALAALSIDQAARDTLPRERRRALDRADALLAHARTIRPAAPDATLLRVRMDLVRFGAPRRATLAAFADSYAQAGFLRQQGMWRLAFAATYWSLLPRATQRAAVEEAIWLVRLDGRLRPYVDQLAAGTPLALPVQLRLLERLR